MSTRIALLLIVTVIGAGCGGDDAEDVAGEASTCHHTKKKEAPSSPADVRDA